MVKESALNAWMADRIFEMHAAGMTPGSLATEFGVSRWLIRTVIAKAPMPRTYGTGKFKTPPKTVLEIRRRYATGRYSMAKLAKIFGLSSKTVFNIIHRKTHKHLMDGAVIK